MLGFKAKAKEAEYPDQNPCRPFSERIWEAISETDGSLDGVEERADMREDVCFRVTMLEIGVVKNIEHAPANAPTVSSSNTGRVVALLPFFCNLRDLK